MYRYTILWKGYLQEFFQDFLENMCINNKELRKNLTIGNKL